MPKPAFLLVEVGVYILAIGCLRHAWIRDRSRLVGLVAGMIYGVLLEYGAIVTFHAYVYGHFLIMIFGAVPLCIGVSWGMIIYTAMETSDRFALPWYLRPILDALLALTIDLSMDAIAIRLGFWTWGQAGAWFGVPLGNFYAWFIVVFGFSLLLRLGRLWSLGGPLALLGDVAVAILAILLSVVGLSTLLRPYYALIAQGAWAWLIISMLLGGSALLAIWAARRTRRDQPLDLVLLSVPLFFHVFSFGALFANGIYRQVPALIPISALMLGVGLLLHLWPSRVQFFEARAIPPVTPAG
jgi:Carotenoid biosynthesis protein